VALVWLIGPTLRESPLVTMGGTAGKESEHERCDAYDRHTLRYRPGYASPGPHPPTLSEAAVHGRQLAALIYLITKRRSMPPVEPEQEREKYRHLRDYPNP
jgi:hypothetical protein